MTLHAAIREVEQEMQKLAEVEERAQTVTDGARIFDSHCLAECHRAVADRLAAILAAHPETCKGCDEDLPYGHTCEVGAPEARRDE